MVEGHHNQQSSIYSCSEHALHAKRNVPQAKRMHLVLLLDYGITINKHMIWPICDFELLRP